MRERVGRVRRVAGLALLSAALGQLGCGFLIPIGQGTKVAPTSIQELVPGRSSQEDVRSLLGEPDSTSGHSWNYERREAWLGVFSTVDAEFTFDGVGVLQEFQYQRMKGTIFPLGMGRRMARAQVLDVSPGKDMLTDVVKELGEPNMWQSSADERTVAYLHVGGNRATSAILHADSVGRVTAVMHMDVPYRISLLSGMMSMGAKLSPEEVLAVVPGETSWEELVERLGQPTVLLAASSGRQWVYMGVPPVRLQDVGGAEQTWLLVLPDEQGKVVRMVWSTGVTYPNEVRPHFAMDVRDVLAEERVSKSDCLRRLGVPSGLLRDVETDRWAYVESWEGRLCSYVLRFSAEDELVEHETRRDFDWAADAAKGFLPLEVNLSGPVNAGWP